MSDFSKKYLEIIKDIDKNIKDKDTNAYVKSKIMDLMIIYAESINSLMEIKKTQESLEKKVEKNNHRISEIEEDIYCESDDEEKCDCGCEEEYEFEITCPFCDYEFITDGSYINQKDITCPKCHKTIELDWNMDDEVCEGECGGCCDHCYNENENSTNCSKVSDDSEKYDKKDNEDDM